MQMPAEQSRRGIDQEFWGTARASKEGIVTLAGRGSTGFRHWTGRRRVVGFEGEAWVEGRDDRRMRVGRKEEKYLRRS